MLGDLLVSERKLNIVAKDAYQGAETPVANYSITVQGKATGLTDGYDTVTEQEEGVVLIEGRTQSKDTVTVRGDIDRQASDLSQVNIETAEVISADYSLVVYSLAGLLIAAISIRIGTGS